MSRSNKFAPVPPPPNELGVQTIRIPYEPRPYQAVLHESIRRFNVWVCHRRFGKTVLAIMEMVDSALRNEKVAPQYAYIAPTYGQAKKVAWEYLKRYTSYLPGAEPNEAELRVDVPIDRQDGTKDKIRFMLLGAENPDSLRGIYLDGCILDEYAQCAPSLWGEIIRPALSDRKGWAIFIGTPKGQNHFYEMLLQAQRLEASGRNWMARIFKASETGVLDDEELQDARDTMSEEEYEQEYECSFTAALKGAYYGSYISDMRKNNQIRDWVPDKTVPVRTAWDLGMSDSTAIWFYQVIGREIHIIDYLENAEKGLEYYVQELQRKGWLYDQFGHSLPHDAAARELGTGRSRQETLEELGFRAHILEKHSLADGIHSVRQLLRRPTVFIHATNCARGILCLENYSRKWDRVKGQFTEQPNHNQWSHGADAFRYLAQSLDLSASGGTQFTHIGPRQRAPQMDYDELGS